MVPLLAKAIEDDVGAEGRWETTTFNSAVVRALGEYARLMTNASAGYRSCGWATRILAFDSSQAFIATNRGSFVLVNNGPGTMYYPHCRVGCSASGAVELGDHHLQVRREWLNAKGNRGVRADCAGRHDYRSVERDADGRVGGRRDCRICCRPDLKLRTPRYRPRRR
ncbi:MAG: hypothetical protein M9935_06400 [Kiritimatiellae bacterium]|nr:hypothetical protein [Kiritimatiellia bacterium]